MTYYFSKTLDLPFDQAIARTTAALKDRGFGVLTTIDVKDTLKKKIGAEFRPYTILGPCNPGFAHKALQAEPMIGTMLPCNVIVQQTDDGKAQVSAVDPIASMAAIKNPALETIATEVRGLLKGMVEAL
ncbi:MAG: DUF302 domain-containing protein [Acidimicrobiia bacterium]|nr:DUF302 domain-containing protein [Acidimicrobiia bacterium]